MTCKEFSHRVSDYIEDELDTRHRAEMDQHAKGCSACAQSLQELRPLTQRLARLSRVRPSVGFDFSLRSKLLMEVARAENWTRKLEDFLCPAGTRTFAAAAVVVLFALGSASVLHEGPTVWRMAGSGDTPDGSVASSAYAASTDRGALRLFSNENSYPVSSASLRYYRTRPDSSRSTSVRPAPPLRLRPRESNAGVQRVVVRF